jgi:hypothetical protein
LPKGRKNKEPGFLPARISSPTYWNLPNPHDARSPFLFGQSVSLREQINSDYNYWQTAENQWQRRFQKRIRQIVICCEQTFQSQITGGKKWTVVKPFFCVTYGFVIKTQLSMQQT